MKKMILVALVLAFIGAMAMLIWSGFQSIESTNAFNRAYSACVDNTTADRFCDFADLWCYKAPVTAQDLLR